ncbi:CDGSH iron-sulfur domain-containing protein [Streptomyces sp. H27-S2]|uniref:CDGSH iron-sulfur domain-containing protein n=1 Tax=Streptomyces antarcticus TaxID=2996458 RepID=UPI002270A297|nr:CDGSH iron-sulfur domain-containing protein [Streptomyces sp. H27-S2]MCY0949802.1 CDGSH iron-sulfur domain-containing protein [Streptomyces sp. H27-S2]
MPSTSDRAADASAPAATPTASTPTGSTPPASAPGGRRPARRVSVDRSGPVLVEGPVEILLEDGTLARSDRFAVAVCTCRRSRIYPWCDTSHRPRERTAPPPGGSDADTGTDTDTDGSPR